MFFPHLYEHENKRDIHARSSSAARLASSRRAAGCGNEPSRYLNFCHALRVYERSLGRWKVFAAVEIKCERCTLRLLSVRFISLGPFSSRRCPLASFSCAYKREVAPLRETHQNFPFLSPPVPISELLLSFSSRLAACTAGRDSRPPKPHSLSPVREKGDKVFGECSARLLAECY